MKPNNFLRFGIAEILTMLVLIGLHMAALRGLIKPNEYDIPRLFAFPILAGFLPILASYVAARGSTESNLQSTSWRCFRIVLWNLIFLSPVYLVAFLNRRG